MSLELWALFGAMILGLVHLTAASFTFEAQVGNAYSVGEAGSDGRVRCASQTPIASPQLASRRPLQSVPA